MKRILAATVGLSVLFAAAGFAQMEPADPETPADPQMPGMQQEAPDVDVDDDELERFAEALVEVQFIQQDAQVEVQDIVDESQLALERFQEIHQQTMAPGMGEGEGADVTDAEQAAYDEAMGDIEDIEKAAAEDMEQAVVDEGLDVERFNMLAQAIPQDPELSQELNEIAQEIMQERGGGMQQPGGGGF